jgi:UDP-N-acetyl-D-mannosaminuronate dehydrogenase
MMSRGNSTATDLVGGSEGMKANETIVVVGLGEVGKPLLELMSKNYHTVGVDITPPLNEIKKVAVLHICYPFQIRDFVGVTISYIERFKPELTIINSTIAVGTTRTIANMTGTPVANSPVRGKHARMFEDLCKYTKFIGAMDAAAGRRASEHFESVGLRTKVLSSPEATELAKLTETTYFGLMIAWAQELERYCDKTGAAYDEVTAFYEEIKFFPAVKYFPGVIGGHCVMPNIEILQGFNDSVILEAIEISNRMKIERDEGSTDSKLETGEPVATLRA